MAKSLAITNPESKTDILFTIEQLAFLCQLDENGSERLAVSQFVYDLAKERFGLKRKGSSGGKYDLTSFEGFRFTRNLGRAWNLPSPVKFYGFPDQVYAYYQNAGSRWNFNWPSRSCLDSCITLGHSGSFHNGIILGRDRNRRTWGDVANALLDALLAARERGDHGKYISFGRGRKRQTLEERIAYWLKKLGLIHEFSVEAIAENSKMYQVRVQKSPSSAKVLITDVGFGVSQILPVLVLCYYVPEGSIVLLEQPEIHLHPSVQSGLADVFIDAVKNRNIQIIVESHSEHLLRRLQRRIADETLVSKDTALYFCEMGKGASSLTPLNLDLFGNIANWPKDFFGDEVGEMAETARAVVKRRMEEQS